MQIGAMPYLHRFPSSACSLIRKWAQTEAPVFFDFGIEKNIWWLLPGRPDGVVYVAAFSRAEFVACYLSNAADKGKDFDAFVTEFAGLANDYEARIRRLSQPHLFRPPLRRYLRS